MKCISIACGALVGLALAFPVSGQGVWTWTELQGPAPSPRWGHAMAYDSGRGVVVLYGGTDANGLSGETWEWGASGWVLQNPATRPPALDGHAMVYDSARKRTVLFGGWDGATERAETWEWNGAEWKVVTLAISPSPRRGSAMAFDSWRNQTVLFGGYAQYTSSVETWVYDGATWICLTPLSTPSPPSAYPMVFDTGRGKAVLFGGGGDVWEWAGGGWAQVPSRMSRLSGHAMAFDSSSGRTTLFGGSNGWAHTDTFAQWDGATWDGPQPARKPPSRGSHAMVYHQGRSQLFMFGGRVNPSGSFGDTWVLDSIPARAPSTLPIGQGCRSYNGKIPTLDLVSWSSNPRIGGILRFQVAGASPLAPCLLLLDWVDPDLSLAPYGAPGCFARVQTPLLAGSGVGEVIGNWQASLKIPAIPSLISGTFYVQVFLLEPGTNALGLITTNGFKVRVGS